VSDERGGNALGMVERRLERKQAKHVIHRAMDLVDATTTPRPDGRTDEVNGLDASRLEARLQPRLKSGASTPTNTSGRSVNKRSPSALRMLQISRKRRSTSMLNP